MTRLLLALAAALGTTGAASAQFQQPYQQPPSQTSSPISPYLNINRNNPAVNYYNQVRPGTLGVGGYGLGAPFTAAGGNRQAFFPQLAAAPDPLQPREVGVGDVLPPAGHPVVFNNTMGYFPSAGRGGGGMRPGLAGVGTTRPPVRK